MPIVLILVLALHVLSAVFWSGTTFALARTGGKEAAQLFRPQMGAAGVAILSGSYLWSQLHRSFGPTEQVLLVGVLCAFAAAGVQAALIGPIIGGAGAGAAAAPRVAIGHRIASALLAAALLCMVGWRYV